MQKITLWSIFSKRSKIEGCGLVADVALVITFNLIPGSKLSVKWLGLKMYWRETTLPIGNALSGLQSVAGHSPPLSAANGLNTFQSSHLKLAPRLSLLINRLGRFRHGHS